MNDNSYVLSNYPTASTSGIGSKTNIAGGIPGSVYYPYTSTLYTVPETITLTKCENGWILKKNEKTYVIIDIKDVLQYLQ